MKRPRCGRRSTRSNGCAASAKTLLARRVADAGVWKRDGSRSPADHLAKLAGTSNSAAKRILDTSRRVEKLPETARAMRTGELSPAKAEAIADAAAVTPDAEDGLLDGADTKSLGEVREECLRAKAIDRDAADRRIHRERRFTQHHDGEGAWNAYARGTTEAQAEFNAAHEPLVDELFKAAQAEGRTEPARPTPSTRSSKWPAAPTQPTSPPTTGYGPAEETATRHDIRGSSGSISPPCGGGGSKRTRSARSKGSARSRSGSPATCWATRS